MTFLVAVLRLACMSVTGRILSLSLSLLGENVSKHYNKSSLIKLSQPFIPRAKKRIQSYRLVSPPKRREGGCLTPALPGEPSSGVLDKTHSHVIYYQSARSPTNSYEPRRPTERQRWTSFNLSRGSRWGSRRRLISHFTALSSTASYLSRQL